MDKEQRERMMFGESIEEMRGAVMFANLNDPNDLIMYAMSILSDAQHILESNPEMARQWINKSKYFMSEANEILRGKE